MKFTFTCFVLTTILLIGGCAGTTATDSQTAAAAAPVEATDSAKSSGEVAQAAEEEVLDPHEVICKRIRKTGTRQSSKVCATRREWELSAERAREATEKMQQRPQHGREY
ncbi:MAG: hypothetical protein EX272_14530 [Chromatiales bacterium]|nr:MAG: hypothetical protein EX272_14530 [Chromatiales bacterium]